MGEENTCLHLRAEPYSRHPVPKHKRLNSSVNRIVYGGLMVQVQLRLSPKTVEEIDEWVQDGRFKNRSDAIKTILSHYTEKEKTREFYKMLVQRSKEAEEKPGMLVGLEEV
jgi:Arc/MetJ-type ribon-helix-helix transcriptional regulator